MNRPIVRLYGLVVLLFALLVAFTSRWTVFEASSLRDNKLNKRSALLEQQRIDRGAILAANGTVLARSVRRAEGDLRTHAIRPAKQFAHAIGYSFTEPGQTGLERYRNERAERTDADRTADDPRPAAGQAPRGRQGGHDARPDRAAGRDRSARRATGRGRRAGTAHRRGQGDGLDAQLRPERSCARDAGSPRSRRTAPARRWSTAPPSSATPRARPSRS